jgi:hypothetical protein
MATALAATYQPGTVTDPARVLLNVTGAPTLTPPYQSNFSASVDGWAAGAGAPTLTFNAGGTPATLRILTSAGTLSTATKSVSGLTVGQTYSVSVMARTAAGKVLIGVSGVGATAYYTAATRTPIVYSFVATLTTHIIYAQVLPPVSFPSSAGDVYLDTVVVARTSGWLGTTITRTDANGTAVVVREAAGGQDATGATGSGVMAVTDYEHALTGLITYTVTDGNGATATAAVGSLATFAPGLWFTIPTTSNPATPTPPQFVQATMVTGFDEASESSGSIHKIIGRADPIVNPGPLSTRAGSLVVWCADYTAAVALRKLLATGLTAQVRQPSFPGWDMYFVGTRVRIAPEDVTASQRWSATIDYQEVAVP